MTIRLFLATLLLVTFASGALYGNAPSASATEARLLEHGEAPPILLKAMAEEYAGQDPRPAIVRIGLVDEYRSLIPRAILSFNEGHEEREAAIFSLARLALISSMLVATTPMDPEERGTYLTEIHHLRGLVYSLESEEIENVSLLAKWHIQAGLAMFTSYPIVNHEEVTELSNRMMDIRFDNPVHELQRRYLLYMLPHNVVAGVPRHHVNYFREAREITQDATNRRRFPLEMEVFEAFIDLEQSRSAYRFVQYQVTQENASIEELESSKAQYIEHLAQVEELMARTADSAILHAWIKMAIHRAAVDFEGRQLLF